MKRDNGCLFANVTQNALGYYELADSCRKNMHDFYENEYFQQDKSLYKKTGYTEYEVEYRTNLYREKESMLAKIHPEGKKGSMLDVGCGEGHALRYFQDNGWSVTGMDFSEFGIRTYHPDMIEHLVKGDLIEILKGHDKKYDFVNMDNVLEHLPNPVDFLQIIKNVCHDNTIVCIRVPNDFSITQLKAYENNDIDEAFWVTDKTSEHFSYFSIPSLRKLAKENGFKCVGQLADFPLDYNLFHPGTNYNKNKMVGHDGHIARLIIENMLFEQSVEKTLVLHAAMADCGVGRNISVFLKLY